MGERSRRLQTVLELGCQQERQQAGELGQAQAALAQQQARLEELLDYRAEYAGRIQRPGVLGAQIANLQAFIARLDQAIGAQRQLLGELEQRLAQAEVAWREAQTRNSALRGYLERLQTQEQVEAGRREQRETDEFAGRSHKPRR